MQPTKFAFDEHVYTSIAGQISWLLVFATRHNLLACTVSVMPDLNLEHPDGNKNCKNAHSSYRGHPDISAARLALITCTYVMLMHDVGTDFIQVP